MARANRLRSMMWLAACQLAPSSALLIRGPPMNAVAYRTPGCDGSTATLEIGVAYRPPPAGCQLSPAVELRKTATSLAPTVWLSPAYRRLGSDGAMPSERNVWPASPPTGCQ